MSRLEYIARVSRKLEFIITLAVLFPTLMYTLQKSGNASEQEASKVFLQWTVYIGAYLFSYLLFDAVYSTMSLSALKRLHVFLVCAIAFYIIPIASISHAINNNEGVRDALNKLFFTGSLLGMMLFSIVLFIILLTIFVRKCFSLKRTESKADM